MSVNKVILLGRLGQDPELKYTPAGTAVCQFSLATSDHWTDKSGQKQEKTEWHRVVVWGKLAEICNQYLSKGNLVYLEGKLQTRSWDDKNGQKHYMTEINASTIEFTGSKNEKGNKEESKRANPSPQSPTPEDQEYNISTSSFTADDIPF